MRIFVSEFICGGAASGRPLSTSLLREGMAMLSALIADFVRIPGCQVVTTLDRRLNDRLRKSDASLQIETVESSTAESQAFDRLVLESDATLVIAPETDGALVCRVSRVHELGGKSLNCLPLAIDLCGDKLRLHDHFVRQSIPTIETRRLAIGTDRRNPLDRACVLKPRDGAGSWLTFAIPAGDSIAWVRAVAMFLEAGADDRALIQPWIAGQPLSVGCLCHSSGNIDIFPIACQVLGPGSLQYQGGSIPAKITPDAVATISRIVRSVCDSIKGLRGYIGIDVLLPEVTSPSPLIVEINPRLTTSYVGYRRLCHDNLAERWIRSTDRLATDSSRGLTWKDEVVSFRSDGLTP